MWAQMACLRAISIRAFWPRCLASERPTPRLALKLTPYHVASRRLPSTRHCKRWGTNSRSTSRTGSPSWLRSLPAPSRRLPPAPPWARAIRLASRRISPRRRRPRRSARLHRRRAAAASTSSSQRCSTSRFPRGRSAWTRSQSRRAPQLHPAAAQMPIEPSNGSAPLRPPVCFVPEDFFRAHQRQRGGQAVRGARETGRPAHQRPVRHWWQLVKRPSHAGAGPGAPQPAKSLSHLTL